MAYKVDRVFGFELDKDVLSETKATKMHNRPQCCPLVQETVHAYSSYSAVQRESSAKADQCSKSKKRNIYRVLVKN